MKFTQQFIDTLARCKEEQMSNLNHVLTLAILGAHPKGVIMTTLSDLLKVSTASVTGLVDTLEKLHLVERMRTTHDRRAIVISITPEGREFLRRVLP